MDGVFTLAEMKLKIALSIFGGSLFGAGVMDLYSFISTYLSATDYGKDALRSVLFESFYINIPLLISGVIIILIALFINRSSSGKASPSVQNNKPGVPGKE